MEISDEDKLILNSEMFLSIRKNIRQNTPSDEIITKIEELLNQGADINACDNNDNNNTVLHIAALKGDKEVIVYLLQKGARLTRNRHKKTALDLVSQTNPDLGKHIAEIITQKEKPVVQSTSEKTSSQQVKLKPKHQKNNKTTTPASNQEITYAKRSGTSGVSGQFYETKLLSLVLHRALHDPEIENFYLAANISNIGDFDDVCFRFDNVVCFMQSKHRENVQKAKLRVENVRSTTGKLGLGIYFESFLKIRDRFSSKANDPMFQGTFEEIDVYFIFYTPLQQEFERKLSSNKLICNKLHEIIYTGEKQLKDNANNEDVFQFDYEERDLDFLTNYIKNKEIKILGTEFLKFVLSNKPIQDIWAIPLIKIYHPALAKKVVELSKNVEVTNNPEQDASNDFLMGKFRPEFFKSNDPNLIALKETFFQEIVYTHSSKTRLSNKELKRAIKDIAENPCSETISTIIGCPIKFDENSDKLSLDIKKIPTNKYTPDEIQEIKYDLQKIQVTRAMVKHAVNLSGQKKLENLSFALSPLFGNTDLKTNKKTEKDEQDRINILADRLCKLINYFAERNKGNKTKIIDISSDVVGSGKTLEVSHLDSNGGIGGAVGNLLKFDTKDKLLTFNTKGWLGKNAKYLLNKLKEITGDDMSNYKINVLIDGFPRDTFETYEYDKNIAAQFLGKLWFYTNQAQEESVETTLKKEINVHYNADKQLFHVHSDAIFLRFHDEIQKWWKRQTNASYLTERTAIFDNAKRDIVDNPLLTVLNVMFVRKVQNIGIAFNVDAIDCLKLDEFMINGKNQILNIVSDAPVLSAAKIIQIEKYTNKYSFISLDYVNMLPDEDRKTMIKELKLIKDMTLVLISESSLVKSLQDTLLEILDHFKCLASPKNQIIVITNKPIETNHSDKTRVNNYNIVKLKDSNVNLLDLTSQSQTAILEKYTVTYQGQLVKLNSLLQNSMELVNGKLLMSLLNKDKIEVGQTLNTRKYDEIKNCYINRNLKRNDEEYAVATLYDIADKIVLISSQPCMGKTILLTHLSLETKKVDPTPWIVTVNLSVHDKDIMGLRYSEDMNAIMVFLCKATLINCDEVKKGYFTNDEKGKIAFNHDDSEDISFELRLFIHSYNSGNIIFLFDGFDKIYPQNTDEGFKVFTAIEEANKRMWITSDCYVIKVLEDKFGSPYKLGRLTTVQQKSFLERFWSTNIQLEKLNHDQFNNITLLINFIRRSFNYGSLEDPEDHEGRSVVPFLSVPLHILYITLLEYFKNDAHSLSSCYLREIIKKKWRLNSFTRLDRYLRTSDSEEVSKLTGTPLHMYIAANYFKFQVTDRFDLHLNTNIIRERSGIFLDALSLYQQFLNVNIKNICEIENKCEEDRYLEQDKVREAFYECHKKLALYAIFQESDLDNILTESEIRDVKDTIKLIESGELKSQFIDSVVDGVPRFYHLLFAEYFCVECLSDLLKRVKNQDIDNINLDSLWNVIINAVLCASSASLRNVFEYKLKCDPELAEAAANDNSKKIMFKLLLKTDEARKARENYDDNALNIAVNEGLVNITNMLINCVRSNISDDNIKKVITILKCGASILEVTDTSRSILSDDALKCIQNIDSLMSVLQSDAFRSSQENATRAIVTFGKEIADMLVKKSGNENLAILFEQFPYHFPEFLKQLTEK